MKKKIILSLLLLAPLFFLTGCTQILKANKLVKVLENDGFTCENDFGNQEYTCIRKENKTKETFTIDYDDELESYYDYENSEYHIYSIYSRMYKEKGVFPMSGNCMYIPDDSEDIYEDDYIVHVGDNWVEAGWYSDKERKCSIEAERKINKLVGNFEDYYKKAGINLNEK